MMKRLCTALLLGLLVMVGSAGAQPAQVDDPPLILQIDGDFWTGDESSAPPRRLTNWGYNVECAR